jgi:hypothetical protein
MLRYTTLHRFKAPFVLLFLKNIEDSPSTCALAKTPPLVYGHFESFMLFGM